MNIKKLFITALCMATLVPNVMAMSYKEAKMQNKPIVLYIYMQTCGACKGFAPIYASVSSKYSAKFSFVKELMENSQLGARLNPDSVPAVYRVEPKTESATKIPYECLSDQACFEGTLNKYGK